MKLKKNKSHFLARRNAEYLFKLRGMDHDNPERWQEAVHQYALDYGEYFKPGCLVSDADSKKSMGMIIGEIKKYKMKMYVGRDGNMKPFMRTKYYVAVRWMYDRGEAINYPCDEDMDIINLNRFRPWRGFYAQKESALQAEPKSV